MEKAAKLISNSFLFKKSRKLYELNAQKWDYPLTKWQKLTVGTYMILRDYSNGKFPPKYENETATFEAEKAYQENLKRLGMDTKLLHTLTMQKPFQNGPMCNRYLKHYECLQLVMRKCGVHPPASILEVGCGSGWISEILAITGFQVVATDLGDGHTVQLRKQSLDAKGLDAKLEYRQASMEYVHQALQPQEVFDAVFVYEALHHAHDWKKAIKSFHSVLAPNGWCFICNEPNLLHTFVSYRVGQLSNTHEIGMNPEKIKKELKKTGFSKVIFFKNRLHWWVKPVWIAAQKSI